jgi:hypothetical protein
LEKDGERRPRRTSRERQAFIFSTFSTEKLTKSGFDGTDFNPDGREGLVVPKVANSAPSPTPSP